MSSVPEKLTKKQRKAAAFREREGKTQNVPLDVPEVDVVEDDDEEHVVPPPRPTSLSAPSGTKRKRGDGDVASPPAKKSKSAPLAASDAKPAPSSSDASQPEATTAQDKKSAKNQRFILFVGNLSYKTTKDSIAQHFSACPSPPTIRLLTPKTSQPTSKSKGCAFIEFPTASSLQAGLRMHHSTLDGRKINVELTSGGGGKGEKRKDVIRSRNKALGEQRENAVKNSKVGDHTEDSTPGNHRHSSTSGTTPARPAVPKTWSVPEGDEKAGRGGQKYAAKTRTRGRKKTEKKWAPSGANAVSVG